VQDDTQEGIVDVDLAIAVVVDEAQFPKFVHEKMTRDRVVPIISDRVSCDTLGSDLRGSPGAP
jgi:hypothetical protein